MTRNSKQSKLHLRENFGSPDSGALVKVIVKVYDDSGSDGRGPGIWVWLVSIGAASAIISGLFVNWLAGCS